jgi:hypothetical protein
MRSRRVSFAFVGMVAIVLAACSEKSEQAAKDGAAASVTLDGVWLLEGAPGAALTVDGKEPPLLPGAKEQYDKQRAARASGDVSFDHTTWCASAGMPRLMFEPYSFEILMNPRQVAFMYEWNRWARLVDMTSNNLEPYYSMSFGTANGRMENGTLTIVTKGIMAETFIDHSGLPHGESLVMTEKLRLRSADVLEDLIHFEDSDTYSAPWETLVTYRRQIGAQIKEDVCLDRIKLGKPAI